MRPLAWFLLGMCTLVVLCGIGGLLYLKTVNGFSARAEPSIVEAWIARKAREMAIPRDADRLRNPVPNSPEVIADARAHWADHCAVCHANDGSGNTEMGRGLYPRSPDMRQPDTQQKSDGALFYVIENGIRLSGMPAWGGAGIDSQDSWKLVRFIRHLPQLTAEEKKEMEKLNPKGAHERKEEEEEEEEEEKFLKGENIDEPKAQDHH